MSWRAGDNKRVEITGVLRHTTADAWLIETDEGDKHWIPISQIKPLEDNTDIRDVCEEGFIMIPEWLARKKGLI